MTCARYRGEVGTAGGWPFPPEEGVWGTRRLPRRPAFLRPV